MLRWLERLFGGIGGRVDRTIAALIRAGLSGIAAAVEFVFTDVTREWTQLVNDARGFARWTGEHARGIYNALHEILTYWIPRYAFTAWWWVTHPASLVSILGWHIVRWLEDNAWDVAHWLGGFVTAVILRNPRRVAHAVEQIIAAIL